MRAAQATSPSVGSAWPCQAAEAQASRQAASEARKESTPSASAVWHRAWVWSSHRWMCARRSRARCKSLGTAWASDAPVGCLSLGLALPATEAAVAVELSLSLSLAQGEVPRARWPTSAHDTSRRSSHSDKRSHKALANGGSSSSDSSSATTPKAQAWAAWLPTCRACTSPRSCACTRRAKVSARMRSAMGSTTQWPWARCSKPDWATVLPLRRLADRSKPPSSRSSSTWVGMRTPGPPSAAISASQRSRTGPCGARSHTPPSSTGSRANAHRALTASSQRRAPGGAAGAA